jgi:GT2 family glycosyltransferase
MLPKVALIYLGYGMKTYLPDVIEAIAALTYPKDRLQLILLPAGSPDGIREAIETQVLPRSGKDLPETLLLDDGQNRGFAGNNNLGIQRALDSGAEYIFLHNGDLKVSPDTITEAVAVAEANASIGSVESLVCYWHEPKKVNIAGCAVHVAGYGYAIGNGQQLSDLSVVSGQEIAYASGAAVLYRASALRKVGLLEEGFFMYHEDLELGLRLRLAGYKNVLATKSLAYHDYAFSRNPKKFAWMELYRSLVILAYYQTATLLLFSPLLAAIEAGSWLMAWRGGWLKAKFWATREWFKPRTWKLLWHLRRRAQQLRVIPDRELLKYFVGKIEHQEVMNPWLDKVINPAVDQAFQAGRKVIFW